MEDTILILEDAGDTVYKKKLKRMKKLPVPDSPQADLLGQTIFEKQAMNEIELEISECQNEINFIDHIPNCKEYCIVELHLTITRYMPRAPWWFQDDLDLKEWGVCNIDGEAVNLDDIPPIRNYKISSYWDFTKESDADTYRFINDRMKWAKEHFRNRIEELKLRNECIGEIGERW